MGILISEIGSNHLGSMTKAKELIRVSKESGANLVKSQAFSAKDINGSMPHDFYQMCEFSFDEYVELIHYGLDIGIEVFYSIFSREFDDLVYHQVYHKTAGLQTKLGFRNLLKRDVHNMLVSIPEFSILPDIKHAQPLSVTEYCTKKPNLEHIKFLRTYYDRPVGLSDHSVDLQWCLQAIKEYDLPVLEKHFSLNRDCYYKGKQYRDVVHSALPHQMETLAKEME